MGWAESSQTHESKSDCKQGCLKSYDLTQLHISLALWLFDGRNVRHSLVEDSSTLARNYVPWGTRIGRLASAVRKEARQRRVTVIPSISMNFDEALVEIGSRKYN
jgi:hypothetical protein